MKKLYVAGVVMLMLLLAAGAAWIVIEQDREGPIITVDDTDQLSWYSGMEKSKLLSGVTAVDNVDGDVTDSLVVESIKQDLETGDKVVVTYAAKDSSNNITKVTRVVDYSEVPVDDSEEENNENDPEAAEADEDGNEDADEATEASAEDSEAIAVAERDAAIAGLPDGSPRLYLKKHYVTLNAGESFDKLSWVQDIIDNKDSREYLFRYIAIEGNVDTSAPGTYELKYYVMDSDRNSSNAEILTVTVN